MEVAPLGLPVVGDGPTLDAALRSIREQLVQHHELERRGLAAPLEECEPTETVAALAAKARPGRVVWVKLPRELAMRLRRSWLAFKLLETGQDSAGRRQRSRHNPFGLLREVPSRTDDGASLDDADAVG